MEKFETTRDVLVVVDVQNDFVTGSLAVPGGEQIVAPINTLAEAVRANGGDVVFTRDYHPKHTPHFDTDGGDWPVHCVAETEGAAFVRELGIQPGDIILSKGMGQTDGYSGWEGIGENGETLEQILTPRTPQERVRALLSGLATDYCILATGLGNARFSQRHPQVTNYLLTDAVRAVALKEADEANALQQMKAAGILAISTDEARAIIERIL